MPYGRKSALRRVKPGGGFGKSLLKADTTQQADSCYQKPDISRLRCGQSTEEVKLSKFLTRDQNVTALETNDYEDFVQLNLFKKVGARDLVICNRDGRTFSAKSGAETTDVKRANVEESREIALASIPLPLRPFLFTDHATRIIDLCDWIGRYDESSAVALEVEEAKAESVAQEEDSDDEESGCETHPSASVESSLDAIGEEEDALLNAITAYFLTQKNRLAPLLTKEEMEFEEAKVFSDWRHQVAELQRDSKLVLTPYEKNLSYWRELWRTLERSDLMLEIVDARNPLLFRSKALEDYITSLGKSFRLCINKADHLSKWQCDVWRNYCVNDLGLEEPLIYSSMRELKKLDPTNFEDQFISINTADSLEHLCSVEELGVYLEKKCVSALHRKHARANEAKKLYADLLSRLEVIPQRSLAKSFNKMQKEAKKIILGDVSAAECSKLSSGSKLVKLTASAYLKGLVGKNEFDADASRFYVGTIGFPNVGKSSIINSLMKGAARVGVSRTPGKTRHMQTLKIPATHESLWLCDCPGLVLPILAGSREDLIINGVISVGTIRGSSTKTIEHLLVRVAQQIEELYNCQVRGNLKVLKVLEDLAESRGFYKSGKGGLPDVEKMSRQLIKQFLEGKSLSFCELPPSSAVEASTWLREEEEKWLVRRHYLNKNLSSMR